MSLTSRLRTGLAASGLALALAAFWPGLALAGAASDAPSVEIYPGQPGAAAQGVLPEGIEWNKPLKAGDLVLTRPTPKKIKPAPDLKAPSLPLGGLKPPTISETKTQGPPPKIAGKAASGDTSSLMLLQGMKNALQQAGQNTEIPKSDLKPVEVKKGGDSLADDVIELQAPVLQDRKAEPAGALVAPASASSRYEPGQAPKNLASGGKSVAAPVSIEAPSLGEAPAPRATELDSAPPSLSSVVNEPSAQESVFGAPVEERAEKKQPDLREEDDESVFDRLFSDQAPETPPAVQAEAKAEERDILPAPAPVFEQARSEVFCEPIVTPWTRSCQEAGYPAYFTGQIVGETRVSCPSNETREVWISNSCAASFVNEKPAAAPKVAEVRDEPLVPPPAASSEPPPVLVGDGEGGVVDASCGPASGLASLSKPPVGELCLKGRASAVHGEGPWHWTCQGMNGGMTVSCAAPVASRGAEVSKKDDAAGGFSPAAVATEDGACGPAAQGGHETAPSEGLCARGTPSRVNGAGPWTWACGGSGGGQAAACVAQKKTEGVCGAAARGGADSMPMRDCSPPVTPAP